MPTFEERKKQLIARGALHRAEVMVAKETVADALRPESLARHLLQHVVGTAVFAFRNGVAGKGPAGLQTMLPLLLSATSALMRKSGMKPLLRALLGASAAGGVAYFALRGLLRGRKINPPDDSTAAAPPASRKS